MSAFVLAYDIGTTGVKTCIFEVDKTIRLIGSASRRYGLYVMDDGGAEQDQEEWWQGMAESTREVIIQSQLSPDKIAGISFCSQMQGLVLTDEAGVPVRRPMSYMDQRSTAEIKKGISYGLQVANANIAKLIPSLIITGAVSSSVKDPMWKCKWVEAHEPGKFARAKHWLDVKDYLISRCTGSFTMTPDSAFGTLLYDTRKGKEGWSKKLCRLFNIKMELLPEIIKPTDVAGLLTGKAAAELGLAAGTPVFGGGGDTSSIAIGSGAVRPGQTHIYSGTSGWVITVTDRRKVDVLAMIAAITGAQDGRFNYFAEMETAGKSIEWARLHFFDGSYDELSGKIKDITPGSGGVIFTPWLHGNRCPFEDPDSTGMYFGLKLETTPAEMFRATVEGVFYHLRWMLECEAGKLPTSDPVRFVGGTALSPVFCQMLADITGRSIETVPSPQNAGSAGAAAICAVGLGLIGSIDDIADFIPAEKLYKPDALMHNAYEKYYRIFKKLYKANARLYKADR